MFPQIHYIYLISNSIQKLWDIFGFFVAGVSVVGVASRMIEAVVAPATPGNSISSENESS